MLHIVPEAVEVPGHCALSQSTTGPFVDSQVTIPRHGRLYLSVPYLNSIAEDLGWVQKQEFDEVTDERNAAIERADEFQVCVERFDEDVQNVSDALISFLAIIKSREALLDELKAARESVATLTDRVVELEDQ